MLAEPYPVARTYTQIADVVELSLGVLDHLAERYRQWIIKSRPGDVRKTYDDPAPTVREHKESDDKAGAARHPKPKPKRTGRLPDPDADRHRRHCAQWREAHRENKRNADGSRYQKIDYCREHGITVKELNRWLNRYRDA